MKRKNKILFRIVAFLIISILLLSNISFIKATTDTETTSTEEVSYYGSLDLVTGETKTGVIQHNNSKGRSYDEGVSETYLLDEFKNKIDTPLVGPQNPNPINPASIIGSSDDRYPIPDQWGIYRACAQLAVLFPDGSGNFLSCVMIAPNMALTAAHCIYDSGKKQFIKSAYVTPGKNGENNNPVGQANVVQIWWMKAYELDNDPNEDWALLRLDSNIGEKSGYIGIARSDTASSFLNHSVTVSGYPGDKGSHWQWACTGLVKESTSKYLCYDADTMSDESGAPVISYVNGQWQVIGVHAHSAGRRSNGFYSAYNGDPNISPATYEFIMDKIS